MRGDGMRLVFSGRFLRKHRGDCLRFSIIIGLGRSRKISSGLGVPLLLFFPWLLPLLCIVCWSFGRRLWTMLREVTILMTQLAFEW